MDRHHHKLYDNDSVWLERTRAVTSYVFPPHPHLR